VDQLDVFRKYVFQAEAIDGMSMSAADFHHSVVVFRAGEAANFFCCLRNQFGFAELIDESHIIPAAGRERASIRILQAISLDFLHCSIDLSQHPKSVHLVGGILLADLAHRKADMNKHPVARRWLVVLQQAQIDLAPHADYIHERGLLIAERYLDDLPWYG
jgi:hypothetical protein